MSWKKCQLETRFSKKKKVEFQMTGSDNLTDLVKPSTSDFSRKTLLKPENGWPGTACFSLKTKVPKIMSRAVPTPNTGHFFRLLTSGAIFENWEAIESFRSLILSWNPWSDVCTPETIKQERWFAYKFFLTSIGSHVLREYRQLAGEGGSLGRATRTGHQCPCDDAGEYHSNYN